MKVSVVVTVYNEEKTIAPLFDSLLSQTRKPDEILVVDGGSKDKTIEIIKKYEESFNNIKLIVNPGSISHGRNIAVSSAKYPIIAQTDAGCVAHLDWLEKLTKPFKDDDVGLVAGFYTMKGDSPFQKAIAPFHGVLPQRYDARSFMPSGRSVAFRKKIWEKVGGYSECLERAGEDTLFNYRVLKEGVKIYRVKDAIVDWQLPKNFHESLKKFFWYAKGDAQAGIWWHPAQGLRSHNIKIAGIFLRYFLGFFLLVLSPAFPFLFYLLIVSFISYTSWSIWKLRDVVNDLPAQFWVPVIQISSDVTIMFGFLNGLLFHKHHKHLRAYN